MNQKELKQFKEKLKSLLSNNEFEKIFEELRHKTIANIIDTIGRYKKNKDNDNQGILTRNEYNIELNKIRLTISSIIEKLTLNDVNPLNSSQTNVINDFSALRKAIDDKIKPKEDELSKIAKALEELYKEQKDNTKPINDALIKQINIVNEIRAYYTGKAEHFKNVTIIIEGKKYKLLKQLHATEYDEIWEAKKVESEPQNVAIKILANHFYSNHHIKNFFKSGAKIQKKYNSYSNTISVIKDFVEDKENKAALFVMILHSDSQSLEQFVEKEKRIDEDYYNKELKQIFRSLFKAVKVLHDTKKIGFHAHRNICPENILINYQKNAYLTNFEYIKSNKALITTPVQQRTTPLYTDFILKPNQYITFNKKSKQERKNILTQVDISSLSLCLLYCLRQEPLQSKEVSDLINEKGWITFINSSDINSSAKSFIKKGLGLKGQKFKNIQDFEDTFEKIDLIPPNFWERKAKQFFKKHSLQFFITLIILSTLTVAKFYEDEFHKQKTWYESNDLSKLEEQLKIKTMFTEPNFTNILTRLTKQLTTDTTKLKHMPDNTLIKTTDTNILNQQKTHTYNNYKTNYYTKFSSYASAIIDSQQTTSNAMLAKKLFSKLDNSIKKRMGKIGYDHERLTLMKLLNFPEIYYDKYDITLLYVGYQHCEHDSLKYIYRYPAYKIDPDDLISYDHTIRLWWKAANEQKDEIHIDLGLKEVSDCKCGLSRPYADINEKMPPPRTFFCIKEDSKGRLVFSLDFIYKPNVFME